MFCDYVLNQKGKEELSEFKKQMSDAASRAMLKMEERTRESALFKTKFQEAVFWGSRAIASHPENFTAIIDYPETGIAKE